MVMIIMVAVTDIDIDMMLRSIQARWPGRTAEDDHRHRRRRRHRREVARNLRKESGPDTPCGMPGPLILPPNLCDGRG
jgi:hypothetical protein